MREIFRYLKKSLYKTRGVTFLALIRYRSDVENLKTFFEMHREKFFAYLMRLTGDYYLAGDIMQESVTRYMEHYADQGQNMPLLYKIARNLFFDHIKKYSRMVHNEVDAPDCSNNQEQTIMVREEFRNTLNALNKLSIDEREILALVADGDLSYREIASTTGTSEANVKVKVHRARRKLREILKGGIS